MVAVADISRTLRLMFTSLQPRIDALPMVILQLSASMLLYL
jgi:hypothetical protein